MKKTLKQTISASLLALALGVSLAQADEIPVGAELPLTGALARVGTGMQEGIQVAVDVFNAKNGKHKIKLITMDDESAPAKAIGAVEKLAAQKVVAITGGYGSGNIGPASDAANKLGIVYITSGGVDDNLVNRGLKYFFRINNNAGYQKAMVGILGDMQVKSVSVIYSTKESTTALAKGLQEELSAKGMKVELHSFDPAISDFKPIINKVKLRDKAEAIVMLGYENDYVGILRAAKVLKPKAKAILGVWSLATPKMSADFPDLMPNVYGTAALPYPADFKTDEGKAFHEAYKRLYKKEPDYLGQFGYVQAMVLFEAIGRAADKGTLYKGGLADELRKTNRETLMGKVVFNEKGDNPAFLHRMGQHQNGKIVIVWPKDAANGKMNFPAVPW